MKTDHGEIHAPIVIAATGPWTRPLVQSTGFDPPIETEFHQVAILKNAPTMRLCGAACIDSVTATYFRSDASDKFLVGDFYGKRPIGPDNFPQRPSESDLEEIIDRAARRVLKLESAEVMRGVTGVYHVTPDSRPLLGPVPQVEGLYLCAGFSGIGFKLSPAIGLVMSELILDGKAQTVDITPFRSTRFQEGRPIKADFEYKDTSSASRGTGVPPVQDEQSSAALLADASRLRKNKRLVSGHRFTDAVSSSASRGGACRVSAGNQTPL